MEADPVAWLAIEELPAGACVEPRAKMWAAVPACAEELVGAAPLVDPTLDTGLVEDDPAGPSRTLAVPRAAAFALIFEPFVPIISWVAAVTVAFMGFTASRSRPRLVLPESRIGAVPLDTLRVVSMRAPGVQIQFTPIP